MYADLDTPSYLSRFERRQQFRWFHRTAPLLVMQAYAAVYVIKTWDEFFDVTGMVRFSLGLLTTVLSVHLLIMEGLLYVKRYATECLKMYDVATVQCESGLVVGDKVGLVNNSNTKYKLNVPLVIPNTSLVTYPDLEGMKKSDLSGQDQSYLTSSSESWTDDSELSTSCSSLSSTLSSSSSSSYCDLNGPFPPAPAALSRSSSTSSSYCDVNTEPASTSANGEIKYQMTSVRSGSITSNVSLDTDVAKKDCQSHQMEHPIVANNEKCNTADSKGELTSTKVDLLKMYQSEGAGVLGRLKSLQDVYVVVDVFKALLCLDVFRQLLVYYSIYYWRLSILQVIPVFVLPSVAIVGEVSLTVVCFMS